MLELEPVRELVRELALVQELALVPVQVLGLVLVPVLVWVPVPVLVLHNQQTLKLLPTQVKEQKSVLCFSFAFPPFASSHYFQLICLLFLLTWSHPPSADITPGVYRICMVVTLFPCPIPLL